MNLRRFPMPAVLCLLLAAASLAQPADQVVQEQAANPGGTPAATPPTGQVVDAPASVRNFRPEEPVSTIATADVVLRKVYEDLGEDATLWNQHVQALASPFFEGRGPGTRGMELAGEYVEFFFKQASLEPAFPGAEGDSWTSHHQPFEFNKPGAPISVVTAQLAINNEALADGTDFVILGNSSSASITAPVTFVGYGIVEGPDDFKSYTSFDADTDLTGRIAMLLRYEPLNDEGKSRWDAERYSSAAGLTGKLRGLVERGAAGILLVNPPEAVEGEKGLASMEASSRFRPLLEIPAAQLSEEAADRLLRQADPNGRNLMALRKLADNGEIKCVPLENDVKVTIAAQLDRPKLAASNIGGVLRGRGNLADQWIIIGAHYDHVGYGYAGVRSASQRGQLHPGADDNASGTAALLLLARRFSDLYSQPGGPADLRSILFLAFSAEEVGLIGSKHYVKNPTIPLEHIHLMFNMDMVGRLRSDSLEVGGTGSGDTLMEALKPHVEASGLTIANSPGGNGPSDHASFNEAGVPVLFLFTGMHPEYHTPADQAYTVNPAGAAKVIAFTREMLWDFAQIGKQFVFVKQAAARGNDRGYSNVRLGITPAMGDDSDGIKVEAVAEGASAQKAGILAGDVLQSWNGRDMTTVRDLFERLQEHKPGDTVNITLRRGTETLTIPVTLTAGRRRTE